jgi:hypothetical protein
VEWQRTGDRQPQGSTPPAAAGGKPACSSSCWRCCRCQDIVAGARGSACRC